MRRSRVLLEQDGAGGNLDIILTAEKGGMDFFQMGFPLCEPETYFHEGGLMVGVLRLVRALAAQGTVVAVDWTDWLAQMRAPAQR